MENSTFQDAGHNLNGVPDMPDNVEISIGKHKIEKVFEMKHLRITFDNKTFLEATNLTTKLAGGS